MSSFQGSKINPSRFSLSQLKIYAYLVPLAAVMLLPIIYIFSTAFKPMDELFAYPPRFFVQKPTMDNFLDISSYIESSGIPLSRYLFQQHRVRPSGGGIHAGDLSQRRICPLQKTLPRQRDSLHHQHHGADVRPSGRADPPVSDH